METWQNRESLGERGKVRSVTGGIGDRELLEKENRMGWGTD